MLKEAVSFLIAMGTSPEKCLRTSKQRQVEKMTTSALRRGRDRPCVSNAETLPMGTAAVSGTSSLALALNVCPQLEQAVLEAVG